MSTIRIGIILGSSRPGRVGGQVAAWVHAQTGSRVDAEFDLIDLADFRLPLLDEEVPPSDGQYSNTHTREWASTIAPYDGFIFVTPEYNHSTSGALKNAIDYLYAEWNNKAAAIVSYGYGRGLRAAEHLRLIFAELQIADVREQVGFSLVSDFEDYSDFAPAPYHAENLSTMLDQLVSWSEAMRGVRAAQAKQQEAA